MISFDLPRKISTADESPRQELKPDVFHYLFILKQHDLMFLR